MEKTTPAHVLEKRCGTLTSHTNNIIIVLTLQVIIDMMVDGVAHFGSVICPACQDICHVSLQLVTFNLNPNNVVYT